MMNIGKPKFKYHVQYEYEGCKPWYIVITSTGRHFYFNSVTKESYWQLSELFDIGVGKEIIEGIDFNEISILTGKVNGLRIGKERREVEKVEKVEKEDEVVESEVQVVEREDEVVEREDEVVEREDEVDEEYQAERDEFIASLLKEEGFVKEEDGVGETEKEVEGVAESNRLNLGYSSLDEDEEEEDEDEGIINNDLDLEVSGSALDPELSDENGDTNDLDLELSDDDGDDYQTSTAFSSLLDDFVDRISIFDPWFIVEEELLQDFIKDPRYYSIEAKQREEIFNQWVEGKAPKDGKTETEVGEFDFAGPISKQYPTPVQLYLNFLQENKDKAKMYYADFKKEMRVELQEYTSSLSESKCENYFRQYSLLLKNFRAYEKAEKKNFPDVNLKKRKLGQFLQSHTNKFTGNKDKKAQVLKVLGEKIASVEDDDTESCYKIWFFICNFFSIPKTVCEDVTNYIVGPKKRVEGYYEILNYQ